MAHVAVAARVLVGLVLVVSAAGKLRDHAGFTASIHDFRLVPRASVPLVAAAVAGTEAAVPVLLVIPVTARAGAVLAAALFAGLTAAVWSAVRRGTGAVCRCFGARHEPLGRPHVVRNITLLGCALAALGGGPVASAGVAVAVGAGAAGALVLLRLEDLVDLFAADP
jgi:uncharacterized membrane protein YphA (DoxX/SURF4 family)